MLMVYNQSNPYDRVLAFHFDLLAYILSDRFKACQD